MIKNSGTQNKLLKIANLSIKIRILRRFVGNLRYEFPKLPKFLITKFLIVKPPKFWLNAQIHASEFSDSQIQLTPKLTGEQMVTVGQAADVDEEDGNDGAFGLPINI